MLLATCTEDNVHLEPDVRIHTAEHIVVVGACGPVDWALDSRLEGVGFDSQCWPCVKVLRKLCIPHCLGPSSCTWCTDPRLNQ